MGLEELAAIGPLAVQQVVVMVPPVEQIILNETPVEQAVLQIRGGVPLHRALHTALIVPEPVGRLVLCAQLLMSAFVVRVLRVSVCVCVCDYVSVV